jgi:hypothetical protein
MEKMEEMQKSAHESHHQGERFGRIKELVHHSESHEAEDNGLPLVLLFLFGMMIFFGLVMFVIFLGLGDATVNITLGNHFTK